MNSKENARLASGGMKSVDFLVTFDGEDNTKPPTKIETILSALIADGKYHRVTAERELHDHALHSTVSTLQNSYGIRIDRKTITVPGFKSSRVRVALYWLSGDQKEKAERLLVRFRVKRGVRT